jgi:hypothetical protein
MKKMYALTVLLFGSLFIQASAAERFLQNKLDAATVAVIDVVELVQQDYIPCPQENIDEIEAQVKSLLKSAQEKKDVHMRLYSFITVSYRFGTGSDTDDSYIYYILLCAEIDPFILNSMSSNDVEQLEKTIIHKLVDLYAAQKLGVEKIIPGCYVSCVQAGVEKLEVA